MSCECDCASCTEFCDCQRCSKPETDLLEAPRNRPGLDEIQARIGNYGVFFTDAKRRLATTKEPLDKLIPQARYERNHQVTVRPEPVEGFNQRFPKESPNLQALGTRDPSDPTIALLDAWSVTADVLTFYRERLTQEAYLRTATDEFSLRELAHMVGFKPRPGIAATTHLAYLLDPSAKPVDINPGAKAQTVPLPGEKMQTFETDKKLSARAEWSQMKPRQTRPTNIDMLDALTRTTLRLDDPSLFVRPGERVLFVFGMKLAEQVVREVLSAKTNIEMGFVELTLKPKEGLVQALAAQSDDEPDFVQQLTDTRDSIANKIKILASDGEEAVTAGIGKYLLNVLSTYFLGADATQALSFLDLLKDADGDNELPFKEQKNTFVDTFKAVANSELPSREKLNDTSTDEILSELFKSAKGNVKSKGTFLQQANQGLNSDGSVRLELAQAMLPAFQDSLFSALKVRPATSIFESAPSVYLLKTIASPFGAVAPKNISSDDNGRFSSDEWPLDAADKRGAAFLDTVVDSITADSFAILDTPLDTHRIQVNIAFFHGDTVSPRLLRFARVRSAQNVPRGSYDISSKVTRLDLIDAESGKNVPVVLTLNDFFNVGVE